MSFLCSFYNPSFQWIQPHPPHPWHFAFPIRFWFNSKLLVTFLLLYLALAQPSSLYPLFSRLFVSSLTKFRVQPPTFNAALRRLARGQGAIARIHTRDAMTASFRRESFILFLSSRNWGSILSPGIAPRYLLMAGFENEIETSVQATVASNAATIEEMALLFQVGRMELWLDGDLVDQKAWFWWNAREWENDWSRVAVVCGFFVTGSMIMTYSHSIRNQSMIPGCKTSIMAGSMRFELAVSEAIHCGVIVAAISFAMTTWPAASLTMTLTREAAMVVD